MGGMGRIYRAQDPRLERSVAIKVLSKERSGDKARRRFAREARAIAALSHPNILVIHDVGEEGDLLYAVTELLEGMTLGERIFRGSLSWREAVRIGRAIAEGLAAAHAEGLVHRDLKPENVFLTHDRRVKVLDFGLAVFSPDRTHEPEESSTHKAPMAGSSGYMAPEQITGVRVDARSDVFSLGCVLYEMLAGQRAFAAKTLMGTLNKVLKEEPTPLVTLHPKLPPELPVLVERCLRKKPGERFSSASEIAKALGSLAAAADSGTRPALWRRAWRRVKAPIERWRRPEGWIRSLAVLPLVSTSTHLDAEYLSDGISEAIVRNLSRGDDLRLVAWGTTERYKLSPKESVEIGRELDVDGVLTGRLLERDGRIRVAVELLETSTGEHLWGETYERELTDPVAVQEELAELISDHLERRIETRSRRPPAETTTTEAFALYLRGRYFWNRRTQKDLDRSRHYFEKALAVDPEFAHAHVGLADVYNVMPFWGHATPNEVFPRAEAQAEEALELQGDCAEAFASLGYTRFFYGWDWPAAREAFHKAVALEPGYATAHHWYGMCAALRQEFETAFRELGRAQELDPLSLIVNADLALARYVQGEPERAVSQCRAALELDASFAPIHLFTGLALEACKRYDEAAVAFERAVETTGRAGPPLAALAHCHAVAGRAYSAQELLAELAATAETSYVSAYHVALVLAGLGDFDEAFKWLRQAAEERSEMFVWLPTDPRLAALRADQRCEELLALLGPVTGAAA